jgi:hypothetical protein
MSSTEQPVMGDRRFGAGRGCPYITTAADDRSRIGAGRNFELVVDVTTASVASPRYFAAALID